MRQQGNYKTTNYKRGAAKEQRIKRRLEKKGLIVLRSAGSKGFADLTAIDPIFKEITFIQAKLGDWGKVKKENLIKKMPIKEGVYNVKIKVL
jgi:Holliday junction resolvase